VLLYCDPNVAYKHVTTVGEAIKAVGVKKVTFTVGEPPPAPVRLDLRIAPSPEGKGKLVVSKEEIERYVEDLKTKGPEANRTEKGPFAWFELPAGLWSNNLITAKYQGHEYALLCDEPDKVMLAEEDGKRTWGLTTVSTIKDKKGSPAISMRFDEAGSRRLAALSEANLGQRLAILIDDKVVSAPVVRSKLAGSAEITGSFNEEELRELARALAAGMVVGSAPPPLEQPVTPPLEQPVTPALETPPLEQPVTPPPAQPVTPVPNQPLQPTPDQPVK
jgi:hypothetical protein